MGSLLKWDRLDLQGFSQILKFLCCRAQTQFEVAVALGMRRENCRDTPNGSRCRTGQVTSSGDLSTLSKYEVNKLLCFERGQSRRGDNAEGFRGWSLLGINGKSWRLWDFGSLSLAFKLRCQWKDPLFFTGNLAISLWFLTNMPQNCRVNKVLPLFITLRGHWVMSWCQYPLNLEKLQDEEGGWGSYSKD